MQYETPHKPRSPQLGDAALQAFRSARRPEFAGNLQAGEELASRAVGDMFVHNTFQERSGITLLTDDARQLKVGTAIFDVHGFFGPWLELPAALDGATTKEFLEESEQRGSTTVKRRLARFDGITIVEIKREQ
ncbi:MAG: hypothetical protein HYV33_01300 [Candidatus Kerfeldbacteria bacterium]|nr:hypothetical protein [Candidatus Kerfeldbacteria bacterium]